METIGSPILWAGFIGFVVLMLALDLGVFHRKAHEVSLKEAALWSAVWGALALVFNAGIALHFGPTAGVEFLTGYLIEKSLSVDNIFVFVVIFGTLAIPAAYQHRILFWGILTALVLRAAMIVGGVALLERFHWVIYVFGAFLVVTGIKMALQRDREPHPERSFAFRAMRRFVPSTAELDGSRFFTRIPSGALRATPLFLALMLIEASDVVFAVDSIPAIFAVTRDPFIVFTSNIFAILGLRSLYFLLAGVVDRFHYLKLGLAAVLVFVGVKMTVAELVKIPAGISLAVVALLLGGSIAASLARSRRQKEAAQATTAVKPAGLR